MDPPGDPLQLGPGEFPVITGGGNGSQRSMCGSAQVTQDHARQFFEWVQTDMDVQLHQLFSCASTVQHDIHPRHINSPLDTFGPRTSTTSHLPSHKEMGHHRPLGTPGQRAIPTTTPRGIATAPMLTPFVGHTPSLGRAQMIPHPELTQQWSASNVMLPPSDQEDDKGSDGQEKPDFTL